MTKLNCKIIVTVHMVDNVDRSLETEWCNHSYIYDYRYLWVQRKFTHACLMPKRQATYYSYE